MTLFIAGEGADFAVSERFRVMSVTIGSHGSDYGICPVSLVARTIDTRESTNLARQTFGSTGVMGPLESKFVLSFQKFNELGLNLNALARGVQNCTMGTLYSLDVRLQPRIPQATGYVRDEPGWDYYSHPFDMQRRQLFKLKASDIIDNKI